MTPRIVLIGNEKGGVGKTTVALTLAAVHAGMGGQSAILDADPGQHSAAAWSRMRAASHPERPSVRVHQLHEAGDLARAAETLTRDCDLVIVDTGAMDSPFLRAGLACAHTLVLPTSADALELWVLKRMEALLTLARPHNPDMRVVVAASRIPPARAATTEGDLRTWMATNTPAMVVAAIAVLVQRTAIARAAGAGLGVNELDRQDPKATAEAETLYHQVMS